MGLGMSASKVLPILNCQKGDSMKFKPLHDRVVVKRLESDEKTSGGIIIPDTAKEKPSEGEVLAVGPGEITEDGKLKPMNVKKGDKILFGKWSGTEVKLDGDDLLIMKESDIMGIFYRKEKVMSAKKISFGSDA